MIRKILFAAVMAASVTTAADAGNIRLHGSSTVANGIVKPNKAKIEQQSSATLSIITNGSGNGLKDLAAGKADVAMISADFGFEASLVNKKAPGTLDTGAYKVHPVGGTKVFFIVNSANKVSSLSKEQVAGILSGSITDWSKVGGTGGRIVLIVERPGQGTRATVEMDVAPIKGKAKTLASPNQIVKAVSQIPGSFSYANGASMKAAAVKAVKGISVNQPLSLVTKGAPNSDQMKLIAAVKAAAN